MLSPRERTGSLPGSHADGDAGQRPCREENSKGGGFASEAEFLDILESVRALFDQLKDLPQATPEEFARERAESAVLAPEEYLDGSMGTIPPDPRGWPDQQLDRQTKWGHEGYLLAYSESLTPDDYHRFQMVVKPQGGIFEASQGFSGSHFGPDCYESKLSASDIAELGNFLKRMPPSNASGKEVHFIVSFSQDGNWVTRTYSSLPESDPLRLLLERMIQQSVNEQ